jgi:hypothetical protein
MFAIFFAGSAPRPGSSDVSTLMVFATDSPSI